ncbi:MAG: tripartite tricarboxylate transporter substrate-binding protein [Acetobacteraceae bacterium]|nr:tripartite tricarboxylate transporter substrate-binding protein [Acetobacteraceae bacterium]
MTACPKGATALRRRSLLGGLAATVLAAPALAQEWPARPIRFVISFPPGGSADLVARVLAPRVEARLRQPIVVDNRPGAGGNIGVDLVAKAAPDGYMIGLGAAGALAINPNLQQNMPYDVLRDLAPVTMLAGTPFVLLASGAVQGGVVEVLAAARARPEAFSMAHGGNGTAMHLTAELLNLRAGTRIQLVPYRGSGPAAAATATGEVQLAIVDPPAALPLMQDRRVRALAVTSLEREASMRDVPTLAEAGVNVESLGWFGLVAPARTPPTIIARLNAAFTEALREPEVVERLRSLGTEPRPTTPEAFAAYLRAELAKWAEVVRVSGARAD